MNFIQILLVALFFLTCAVLVLLIMLQSGKGGGMGIFGGGGSSTPFGTSTIDVVAKATWWGVVVFFVIAILAAISFADTQIPEKIKEKTRTEEKKIPFNLPDLTQPKSDTKPTGPSEKGDKSPDKGKKPGSKQ